MQVEWDSRYADKGQMLSGQPSGALVARLTPGRVLDVGGSDGADALWLAMIAALLDDDWVVEVNEQRPPIAVKSGREHTTLTMWCCAHAEGLAHEH